MSILEEIFAYPEVPTRDRDPIEAERKHANAINASIRNTIAHEGAYNPHQMMKWRNRWTAGQYYMNDVVYDQGWAMVANKDTQDRAAPQPAAPPAWSLPETPTWAEKNNTSVVYSGHHYIFNRGGWLNSIRVWVPEFTGTTNYRFVIIRNPNTDPVYTVFEEPVLTAGEWNILAVASTVMLTGEELIIYIDAFNQGGETTWAYNWTMQGSDNNITPTIGNWNTNVQQSLLRINWTDDEAIPVGHQLELQVVPNTVFEISEVGDATRFVHFRTNAAYVEGTDWTEYDVMVVDEGSVSRPRVGEACQIRAVQPVPDPTKYVDIVGHWAGNQPGWATVTGFLQYDGVTQPGNDNTAYGIDVNFTPADISPDWDLLAYSGG